jgi:hypothetical protein
MGKGPSRGRLLVRRQGLECPRPLRLGQEEESICEILACV